MTSRRKALLAAVRSAAREASSFYTVAMFTVATGLAALLNDAVDGNPRFTVFAFGLCLLGALALVSLICVIMTAVRRANDGA